MNLAHFLAPMVVQTPFVNVVQRNTRDYEFATNGRGYGYCRWY